MNFLPAKSRRLLMAVATVLPVLACAPVEGQGQMIIFSSPANDTISSNVPSLVAPPPDLNGMAASVNASSLHFNNSPEVRSDFPLPMPPPVTSPGENQDPLAPITPEQIFGIPTAEKIFGLPEKAAEADPNRTAGQGYWGREGRGANYSNNISDYAQWSLPGQESNSVPGGVLAPNRTQEAFFSQFLTPPGQNQNNANNGGFYGSGAPSPARPKLTPEQIADEEAFQKLLSLHTEPPPAGDEASSRGRAAVDPFLAQPQGNPMGGTFAPLTGNVGLPATVKPLPILGQPALTKAPTPEWVPQPPPWLASGPQPGEIPQRKF